MKYSKDNSDEYARKEWDRAVAKRPHILHMVRRDYKARLFEHYRHWRYAMLQKLVMKPRKDVRLASGITSHGFTFRTELEMAEIPPSEIVIDAGQRKMGGLHTNTGTLVSQRSAARYNKVLEEMGLFKKTGSKLIDLVNTSTGEVMTRSVDLWCVMPIASLHRSLIKKYRYTLLGT